MPKRQPENNNNNAPHAGGWYQHGANWLGAQFGAPPGTPMKFGFFPNTYTPTVTLAAPPPPVMTPPKRKSKHGKKRSKSQEKNHHETLCPPKKKQKVEGGHRPPGKGDKKTKTMVKGLPKPPKTSTPSTTKSSIPRAKRSAGTSDKGKGKGKGKWKANLTLNAPKSGIPRPTQPPVKKISTPKPPTVSATSITTPTPPKEIEKPTKLITTAPTTVPQTKIVPKPSLKGAMIAPPPPKKQNVQPPSSNCDSTSMPAPPVPKKRISLLEYQNRVTEKPDVSPSPEKKPASTRKPTSPPFEDMTGFFLRCMKEWEAWESCHVKPLTDEEIAFQLSLI